MRVPPRVRAVIPDLIALAAAAAVVLVIFWKPVTAPASQLLFGSDTHQYGYFYWSFVKTELSRGRFPLWNPYTFGGEPMLEKSAMNVFYPVGLMRFVLPVTTGFTAMTVFHVWWAMAGMYVLVRRLGSRPAAFAAGVMFGASGFFVARVYGGHVELITAASWIPWVIWSVWRAGTTAGVAPVAVAALTVGMQLLSGYPVMGMFALIAAASVGIAVTLSSRSFVPGMRMAAAVLWGVGISAVQTVPGQQYIARLIRSYEKSYAWISYGSIPPVRLSLLWAPFRFGDIVTYGPYVYYWEHAMFVGVTGAVAGSAGAVIVAAAAAVPAVRRRIAPHWPVAAAVVATGVLAAWIAMAEKAPLFDLQKFLWEHVFFYRYLRLPTRHLTLVVLAVSFTAGFGLSSVHRLARRLGGIAVTVAGLVLAWELIVYGRGFMSTQPVPETHYDRELVALLSRDSAGLHRVAPNYPVWHQLTRAVDFNAMPLLGMFSVTGYDPLILRPYYEFILAANGYPNAMREDMQVPYLTPDSAAIAYMGVAHVIEPVADDAFSSAPPSWGLVAEREQAAAGWRVYRTGRTFDRFFFVSDAQLLPRTAVFDRIRSRDVNLSTTVLIDEPQDTVLPQPACRSGEGTVSVSSYMPNRIELSVSSPCGGYLASSEVMYPGWTATVDGKPATVYRGNLAFRTVYAEPGTHRIIYEFRPVQYAVWGAVSLVLTAAAMLASCRRGHAVSSHR